ncbi:MAG: STAS domain-containing protein [Planctomycetes bacterium]|nr:STAS domain-containing protein [Planctomycetota bacterium]
MDRIQTTVTDLGPGVCELCVHGAIDWANFERFKEAVDQIFKRKIYRIIVNLKGTDYISSTGVGCILGMLDTVAASKGEAIFVHVCPEVMNVFEVLGLSQMLRFASSTEAAADMLKTAPQ